MIYAFRELVHLVDEEGYDSYRDTCVFFLDEPEYTIKADWLRTFIQKFNCHARTMGNCVYLEFDRPEDETAFRLKHIL